MHMKQTKGAYLKKLTDPTKYGNGDDFIWWPQTTAELAPLYEGLLSIPHTRDHEVPSGVLEPDN